MTISEGNTIHRAKASYGGVAVARKGKRRRPGDNGKPKAISSGKIVGRRLALEQKSAYLQESLPRKKSKAGVQPGGGK